MKFSNPRSTSGEVKSFFAIFALVLLGAFGQGAFAQDIDPDELLRRVDDNLWSQTKIIEGRLIVDNGRRERTLQMQTWMEGVERSYSVYLNPPRERGVKMLKARSKLWMYTPRTDRKILIAGHMLRQSMMGSDLSYEDMMEDKMLSRNYKSSVEKFEEFEGVPCVVLLLTANDKTTTYQSRKLWIDPEKKTVLMEEMYAKSGKLLKNVHFKDYRPTGDRLFPKKMIFRDLLKENTKTTYEYDSIEFDAEIPAKYFSQSILKR